MNLCERIVSELIGLGYEERNVEQIGKFLVYNLVKGNESYLVHETLHKIMEVQRVGYMHQVWYS